MVNKYNHEYALVQVVETKYCDSEETYELHVSFAVEFDGTTKKILLDVPLEGIALESGWEITPLYNPLVRCGIIGVIVPTDNIMTIIKACT